MAEVVELDWRKCFATLLGMLKSLMKSQNAQILEFYLSFVA